MSMIMSFASLGSYRLNTMKAVKQHFGSDLSIYSGDRAPEMSIKLIQPEDLDYVPLRNLVLPHAVVLQNIPLARFLECDVLLMDLNPRMPWVWAVLIARRALRKRTLLWGHAFPRAGRTSKSEWVRNCMRRLASGLVAYTVSQAAELKAIHAKVPVWSAPNALYHRSSFAFDTDCNRNSFVYVGRLHPDKKPLLMIAAFEEGYRQNPDLRLVIVGDGPLRQQLEQRVSASPAAAQIDVLGHLEDYDLLRDVYSCALASLSPGYVGLSVTQSLSFGVPMIISKDEPHAPELEAVRMGFSGEYFTTNDAASLANRMLEFARDRASWQSRGQRISQECANNYSVESMVDGLIRALRGQL